MLDVYSYIKKLVISVILFNSKISNSTVLGPLTSIRDDTASVVYVHSFLTVTSNRAYCCCRQWSKRTFILPQKLYTKCRPFNNFVAGYHRSLEDLY